MTTIIIATITSLAIVFQVWLLWCNLNNVSKEHAKWLRQKSHR